MFSRLKDPALLKTQCYIDGQWCDADGKAVIEVNNPATGEILASVPKMGRAEAKRAVDAAQKALKVWQAKTAKERSNILRKWFNLMMEAQEDLGILLTLEQGKPLAEAKGEIAYGASYFEWYAEEAKRIYGDTIPGPSPDKRILVLKQPIGVCAAITPWNFPNAMITRKAAPALAAGCAMLVKPASPTPLTAYALLTLARRSGLPAGVLDIVCGQGADIAALLAESPVIRKISFTGSTETGREIVRQSAQNLQKLSLELGGNAPALVFDDADLDKAVNGVMAAKFRNSGQTCVCANRVYVQAGVYDEFCRRLARAAGSLKVGNGLETGVEQGPLINQAAVDKVQRHIDDALAKGAQCLVGGGRIGAEGTWFQPTVLTGCTAQMRVAAEETFGPLCPVFRFETEAEALAAANATEYGLAAYLFTENPARQWRVAEALEYGMVGINTGLISNEAAPFGGIKASGQGREGSRHGINEYLEMKYLCVDAG